MSIDTPESPLQAIRAKEQEMAHQIEAARREAAARIQQAQVEAEARRSQAKQAAEAEAESMLQEAIREAETKAEEIRRAAERRAVHLREHGEMVIPQAARLIVARVLPALDLSGGAREGGCLGAPLRSGAGEQSPQLPCTPAPLLGSTRARIKG